MKILFGHREYGRIRYGIQTRKWFFGLTIF